MGEPLGDTPTGQFLRYIVFKSWFYYPEELPGFKPPTMPILGQESPSTTAGDLKKISSQVIAKV